MNRSEPNSKMSTQLHHFLEEMSLDPMKRVPKKAKVQVLPTPVKSPNDQKEYEVIRLPNGLTACLISDCTTLNNDEFESHPDYGTNEAGTSKKGSESKNKQKKVYTQKMAGAALCVGVGHFSDPKSIPGLAHLLEHMVSMGHNKFPGENVRSFFTSRGWISNAATNVETTRFNFNCPSEDFLEGLDKFSQLFISPIMSLTSITIEREIIDLEFQKSRLLNLNRKTQLLRNLAKQDSPVNNNFDCGNLKTLRDNVNDADLYNALHEFRKRHYSAHRMTLVVQASLPIELLETYVSDCFADVPCNNLPPDDFSKFKDDVYDTPVWNRIYFMEPTADIHRLEITFALPSLIHMYKTKPLSYVSKILSDEGKGSLMSYLRKKVWAWDIMTGPSEHNSLHSFFCIYIHLTAKGLDNLFTIIKMVFSYINMMKTLGPRRSIYHEMKYINDISFTYADEQLVDYNVQKIAKSMQIHPSEDYLTGPDLVYEYDPEGINMVMNYLVPRKANIIVMTEANLVIEELNQREPIQYDKTEKWFGTRYTDFEIPEEKLLRWENAQPSDKFTLPLPNQFLAENFEIVPSPTDGVLHENPIRVFKIDSMEFWYRNDKKFRLPKAIWYIKLQPQFTSDTLKYSMMLQIFIELISFQLAEYVSPAIKANLSYIVTSSGRGLIIKVSGLNQKLPVLLGFLVKNLKRLTSNLTEETLAVVKACALAPFYNILQEPFSLAHYYFREMEMDELKVTSEITLEDMKTFAEQFLKQLYVTVFVQGNVSAIQASLVAQKILQTLCNQPFNKNDNSQYQTCEIPKVSKAPKGPSPFFHNSLNKGDSCSIVYNCYESDEYNMKTVIILDMTVLLIQAPLFDILRTKEQLGYTVECAVRQTLDDLGISVAVKTQYNTRYVDERIDSFMKQMYETLKDMSETDFEKVKGNLIKKKQCQNHSFDQEVQKNWNEISSGSYQFGSSKRDVESEIELAEKLKLSDVLDWWEKNIVCKESGNISHKKKSLQILAYGSQKDSTQET